MRVGATLFPVSVERSSRTPTCKRVQAVAVAVEPIDSKSSGEHQRAGATRDFPPLVRGVGHPRRDGTCVRRRLSRVRGARVHRATAVSRDENKRRCRERRPSRELRPDVPRAAPERRRTRHLRLHDVRALPVCVRCLGIRSGVSRRSRRARAQRHVPRRRWLVESGAVNAGSAANGAAARAARPADRSRACSRRHDRPRHRRAACAPAS